MRANRIGQIRQLGHVRSYVNVKALKGEGETRVVCT